MPITLSNRPRRLVRPVPFAAVGILLILGGLGLQRQFAPRDLPGVIFDASEDRHRTIETGEVVWPEDRVDGEEAKRILLAVTESAVRYLEAKEGFTATFVRQERHNGKLGPEQTQFLKIRHQPFSVYLKFLAPKAGKEVLFVEGERDNKLMAHNGDWTRKIIPRLEIEPTSAVAMVDNRHPITDAGLLNLTRTLRHYRWLDLDDPAASTVLETTRDDDGRVRLVSTHRHAMDSREARPFHAVRVEYDPETYVPMRVECYDWPPPGSEASADLLGESYDYRDVVFVAGFEDGEFDPANPAYEFMK